MTALLLFICSAVGLAQHPDHGQRPHHFEIEPKYSRLTPFRNEDSFPKPVFGMAHGFPYASMRKDIGREFTELFPSLRRRRPTTTENEEGPAHGGPPKKPRLPPFFPTNAKNPSSGESNEIKGEQAPERRRVGPIPGSNENEPIIRLPPWVDSKEFPIRGRVPRVRDSNESGGRDSRPRMESEEKPQLQMSHSAEEKPFFRKQSRPNDSRESRPGAGFDSHPSAKIDLREFGARNRKHGGNGEDVEPEHPRESGARNQKHGRNDEDVTPDHSRESGASIRKNGGIDQDFAPERSRETGAKNRKNGGSDGDVVPGHLRESGVKKQKHGGNDEDVVPGNSREFGTRSRKHGGNDEDVAPEQSSGKVVGVDMRMVAGLFPRTDNSHQLRRFLPINGRDDEQFQPPPQKRRGLRRKLISKNVTERRATGEIGESGARHYGEFDAYFEKAHATEKAPVGDFLPSTQQLVASTPFEGTTELTSHPNETPQIDFSDDAHKFVQEMGRSLPASSNGSDVQRVQAQATTIPIVAFGSATHSNDRERGDTITPDNRQFSVDTRRNNEHAREKPHRAGCRNHRISEEKLRNDQIPVDFSSEPNTILPITSFPLQRAIPLYPDNSVQFSNASSPFPLPSAFALAPGYDQANFRDISKNQSVDCGNGTRSRDFEPLLSSTVSFWASSSVPVTTSFLFTTSSPSQESTAFHAVQSSSSAPLLSTQLPGHL